MISPKLWHRHSLFGFMLFELLIGICILCIFVPILCVTLLQTERFWQDFYKQDVLYFNRTYLWDFVFEDLRHIQSCQQLSPTNCLFVLANGQRISYTLVSGKLSRKLDANPSVTIYNGSPALTAIQLEKNTEIRFCVTDAQSQKLEWTLYAN